MEIKPILLSLKHNKVLSLLIILQVAFTLAVVSNSLFVTTATLKEWNLPSGLDHENIVSVQTQFYDLSVDSKRAVEDDIRKFRELPGVINATTTNQTPFGAENVSEVYLETTVLQQALFLGLGQVAGNHLSDHLAKRDFWLPAQFIFRF